MEEPEAASLRTESTNSMSNKDFSEISENVKKSICRMIKETQTNQSEILKMVENLSSKIDSLSGTTPEKASTEATEFRPRNEVSTSGNFETDSTTPDEIITIITV